MKIALVSRRAGRGTGTAGYVDQLARSLVQQGHAVDVWAEIWQGTLERPYGVQTMPSSPLGGLAGLVVRSLRAKRIKNGGYDVVHGFGRTLGHDVFRASGGVHEAWLAASGGGRRSLKDRTELRIDRAACREARRVICTSKRVARDLVALYGVDEAVVRLIRNGVSNARFRPDARRRELARRAWKVPHGGRALLFLGHGFERKGLQFAAEGFRHLARPEDRLVVIGSDRNAPRWRSALAAMLGERMVWWGPVAHPEHWLPGADATILPTRYDAGANTTLESLSAGVPPVVSVMDGNSEVVPSADWVLPRAFDATETARAIDSAWSAGAEQRADCVTVARCWSVERNVTATAAVYQEVCDG